VGDTTQIQTDTTASSVLNPIEIEIEQVDEPVEPDEPPIDLVILESPEFSFFAQTLSSDKRETKLVIKLNQLLEQFRAAKFVAIRMWYVRDDAVGMGKERQDETWYYNANRQLCAFSGTYKTERTTRSELYLCKEGELLALTSDNEFQDEGPHAYTSVRIVSSLCPQCGLTLSKEEEGEIKEYESTVIEQSDLDKYSNDFFSKHEEMLKGFKEVTTLTKIGDRYSAFVFVNSDTIKYSIDSNLINKFFKNSLMLK
jgi:hypothetical protein